MMHFRMPNVPVKGKISTIKYITITTFQIRGSYSKGIQFKYVVYQLGQTHIFLI